MPLVTAFNLRRGDRSPRSNTRARRGGQHAGAEDQRWRDRSPRTHSRSWRRQSPRVTVGRMFDPLEPVC